jgi:sarcosine/dimethylglycine N-methyltransferase
MQEELLNITKNYYDSQDADEFYHTVWGGEDIHIGIYDGSRSIREASRKTVELMADKLGTVNANHKLLDMGAGYGGAARYLASRFDCRVDCLNLSGTENKRNAEKNKAAGLNGLINVVEGNFEEMPFEDNSFDVVWSQDAILHSNRKEIVFKEAYRVLKHGGLLIFTDPMQADDCPEGVLQPVLERIHLQEMGSVAKYRRFAASLGLEEVEVHEMPEQLVNHYSNVLAGVNEHFDELKGKSSPEYLDKMKKGLQHWINAGKEGYLNWGILQFRKK